MSIKVQLYETNKSYSSAVQDSIHVNNAVLCTLNSANIIDFILSVLTTKTKPNNSNNKTTKEQMEIFEVMDMFSTLIVVMVSQRCESVQPHQKVYIKRVQLFVCQF